MSVIRERYLALLLAGLLVLAPLLYSGKTALALLTIEVLALGLWLTLLLQPNFWRSLPSLQRWLLAGLALLPILYLIPMPAMVAEWLPGRDAHQLALSLALPISESGLASLSLMPSETFAGWFKLLIPLAVFTAALQLPLSRLEQLCWLFLAVAGFQALIGLLQYGGGLPMPAVLDLDEGVSRAAGTYTSPNNFAGLLYLALMPCLALYIAYLGRFKSSGKSPLRKRLLFWSTSRGQQTLIFGALAFLLILGIIFSRSRAGIGVTIIGIPLLFLLLAKRVGGAKASIGMLGRVITASIGVALAIGLAPVWQRFTMSDPASDGRVSIFDGTFDAIHETFPVGFGPALFQESFHPWQYISFSKLINQAHNSYLEWVYDAGVLALALIILALVIYVRRWFSLWRPGDWGDFRYLQVGAGIGLLLMALHELADYNLYVPANMVAFAFMAAVFLYPYQEPPAKRRKGSTRRVTSVRERELEPAPAAVANPFMD